MEAMATDDPTTTCAHCREPRGRRHRCRIGALKLVLADARAREQAWHDEAERARHRVASLERLLDRARKDLEHEKKMRRTEREGLVAWLDRRLDQQREALDKGYISGESKKLLEIEVSMLERYRGIIVDGKQRNEDPLMPRFLS